MANLIFFVAVALLGMLVVSVDVPASALTPNPTPCAAIASMTNSFLAISPSATPTIPAEVAYACLQSVPNKPGPALKLIESLKAFIEWQSTLAFLKNPPKSYAFPAVDILGELHDIAATVEAGGFSSEYDFQLKVYHLITSAHDGHLWFQPDIFKVFGFKNDLIDQLVTVSSDGIQVPKVYQYTDLVNNEFGGTISPKAIVKISDEDAAKAISKRSAVVDANQDPDAQWNDNMFSYANAGNTSVYLARSADYQGHSLTITYDTGETVTEEYVAFVHRQINLTGVNTGEDFYSRFCTPARVSPSGSSASPAPTTPVPQTTADAPAPILPGYPYPVARDAGYDALSGYFLNGTDYDDVAVLVISSFDPLDKMSIDSKDVGAMFRYWNDFQSTLSRFLENCRCAGKRRLVIDVINNGGGYIALAHETFAQLFPQVNISGTQNLRESDTLQRMAHVAGDWLSEIVLAGNGDLPNSTDSDIALALQILDDSNILSNIVPGQVVSPAGENLTTVEAILKPVFLGGDRFTAYQFSPDISSVNNYNATGYGNRKNPPPAVFHPDNIVLLTNGACASACTLFGYLLSQNFNVSTVAIGGRPQPGMMQWPGGVEGAQVFPMSEISVAAAAILTLNSTADNYTNGQMELLAEAYALQRASSPGSGSVNGKNAFDRSNQKVPLQFLFEPADCRFFYTREMITDPTKVWERAVDTTWKDPEGLCVEGSRPLGEDIDVLIDRWRSTIS
ncbi:hypothetical protein QBC43DRAFT_335495 [Cladorrhinum sp. PSN259]|nr:hypothetical protein QBC43DRAFT_335495 [Cladorrhinum sp. PSN259]